MARVGWGGGKTQADSFQRYQQEERTRLDDRRHLGTEAMDDFGDGEGYHDGCPEGQDIGGAGIIDRQRKWA